MIGSDVEFWRFFPSPRGLALMDEFGVEPDVFTCNIMIDSCRSMQGLWVLGFGLGYARGTGMREITCAFVRAGESCLESRLSRTALCRKMMVESTG